MSLLRTCLFGFLVGAALLGGCEESEEPNPYGGTTSPTNPAGGGTGGNTGGTVPSSNTPSSSAPDSGTLQVPDGGSILVDAGLALPSANDAGATLGSSSDGGSSPVPSTSGACPGLPAVTDYAAKGPFDVKVITNAGPTNDYYLFRPDTTLGKDGFKHPVAVWGNGILTTPDQYQKLLGHLASHGFVVIACPSDMPERPCLNDGMDWLVKQNTAEGPLKDKLDITKEITIGYSWGGGAAIDTANRPNVKATVSIHGMPPRDTNIWGAMKSPLLLFTSTGDTFVNAEMFVTPNYNSSKVNTFYATLLENVGHLYPIDEGAVSCAVDLVLGGPCAAAIKEQAPTVAWLRHWVCGDENAKKYFYGADCTLCKSPWKSQNKPTGIFK
jgi:hypothetical protein